MEDMQKQATESHVREGKNWKGWTGYIMREKEYLMPFFKLKNEMLSVKVFR
jgi:hypothetical protein